MLGVFASVFIAELGDKTQLATMPFAADKEAGKLVDFLGASLPLVATSAIGVLAGGLVSQYLRPRMPHNVAGRGFTLIGVRTLARA